MLMYPFGIALQGCVPMNATHTHIFFWLKITMENLGQFLPIQPQFHPSLSIAPFGYKPSEWFICDNA
jgi:hypothetical protein